MPSESVAFVSADQEKPMLDHATTDQPPRYQRCLPFVSERQRRGPAGPRKGRPDHSCRRDRRPARPLRIGQVDAAAHHRRADRALLGRGAVPWRDHQGPPNGVAMVFQSFALFPWLTVLQNVELGLEALGIDSAERRTRALAAIDLIGLDGFDRPIPRSCRAACASASALPARWSFIPTSC